jgi:hypothetical protein
LAHAANILAKGGRGGEMPDVGKKLAILEARDQAAYEQGATGARRGIRSVGNGQERSRTSAAQRRKENAMTEDPVVRLEVVLDLIDTDWALLAEERRAEKKRTGPDNDVVQYLDTEARALRHLKDRLSLNDKIAVDEILAAKL